MTKFIRTLTASLVLPFLLVAPVFAAPYDWQVQQRNSDDTAYVALGIPTRPATTFGLLGGDINGDNIPAWYFFSPQFSITATTTGYAGYNYYLTVLPPNDADVGNLSNDYTSSSTFRTLNSTVTSLSSSVSSLSGTSANLAAFLNNSASTTPYVASSTPGFMSAAMVTTVNSMSAGTTTKGIAYEGTTERTNAYPIFKSATIASGVAVVNFTNDGLSTGTSLCPNGIIQDSVSVIFNDSTASFQQSWAFSNSNKTLTVTANKFTTANILSGILGQAAANGSVVKVTAWCY